MDGNNQAAIVLSPEYLVGTWYNESSIMEFTPDQSYRLITGIEACHDQLVSSGQYTVEQFELKLDPVTGKDAAGNTTYQAIYKVEMLHQEQPVLKISALNDQNERRKALLDGKPFQLMSRCEDLVFAVREAGIAVRRHLNDIGPRPALTNWQWAMAWLRQWLRGQRDPVRLKNLERIAAHLQTLQHFLANPGHTLRPYEFETLPGLLGQLQKPEELSFSSAWEIADELQGGLLAIGGIDYIKGIWFTWPARRIPEWLRDQVVEKDRLLANDNTINHMIKPFLLEDQRDLAQEYRRERAMILLRKWDLVIMAVTLLVLDAAFCYFYQSISKVSWDLLLLVGSAGAIGSVLSRATKLSRQPLPSEAASSKGQDPPLGIRSLMSAVAVFWAQPIIGATAALIVYLIFESTLMRIQGFGEPTTEVLAILAFITGFSEPFLTDVIGKVSGKVV